MRNYLFRALALLISGLICAAALSAEIPEREKIRAYILIEPETGTIIDEYNGDVKFGVGYLVKLMSILIIAEDINSGKYTLNDELIASESVRGTKGAVIWLEPGDISTVEELLKAVIIGNANDALTVLIERSAENIDTFIMNMNAKAFDLGIRNTYFTDPYGYSTDNTLATAHDIALICSELFKFDFLKPIFSTWREFIRSGKTELVNENSLSRTFSEHIGFKACHSDKSLFCIAEGAEKSDGRRFVSVVLGADNEDIAAQTAKKLIKGGFKDYTITSTMFPEEMLMPVKVKGGRENAVEICVKESTSIVVPRDCHEVYSKVIFPNYLTAPVRSEQPVGIVAFYNEKRLVFETEIITKTEVKCLDFPYIIKHLLSKLIEK